MPYMAGNPASSFASLITLPIQLSSIALDFLPGLYKRICICEKECFIMKIYLTAGIRELMAVRYAN
jgi:hypothetical protein